VKGRTTRRKKGAWEQKITFGIKWRPTGRPLSGSGGKTIEDEAVTEPWVGSGIRQEERRLPEKKGGTKEDPGDPAKTKGRQTVFAPPGKQLSSRGSLRETATKGNKKAPLQRNSARDKTTTMLMSKK